MSSKVVLHIKDKEIARIEKGLSDSLYFHVKTLLEGLGGEVVLSEGRAPRTPDGDLHIIENAVLARPECLAATTAYLKGCWHLDPNGVLAASSIGKRRFRSEIICQKTAENYVEGLRDKFTKPRFSRYKQAAERQEIEPGAIVVFLQGPQPELRKQAYLSSAEMLHEVLLGAAGRPVYVKPHPLKRLEGQEMIDFFTAEGFTPISTDANVHDLLEQADVSVSINSAASIEGMLHNTPTILFGKSDFSEAAHQVRHAGEFSAVLSQIDNLKFDYTLFLYWYFSQCLWVDAPDFEDRFFRIIAAAGFDRTRLGLSE